MNVVLILFIIQIINLVLIQLIIGKIIFQNYLLIYNQNIHHIHNINMIIIKHNM